MANRVLSIYVGNDAIRVAEMQKNKNDVQLTNAAEIATPDGSISDGYLMDISAIAEAIRTATFGRGFTAKEVIFDVNELEYISSAGLRQILQLKKQEKDFSIINASTDVYDIFDMTGFTEMMNIKTLGVVMNMAYVLCPDCGKKIRLFGSKPLDELAKDLGVTLLDEMPLDPSIAALVDAGKLEDYEGDYLKNAVEAIKAL